jgi:hypothetical protein
MTITINESGLTFGPFSEESCFHIENSTLYREIGEGVKTVEFMLVKRGKTGELQLYCVEAKQSVPRPGQPRFEEYFADVRDKMIGALLVFLGARVGRFGARAEELPTELRDLPLSTSAVKFVLVITTARRDWLPPLHDKLRSVMQPTAQAFGIQSPAIAVVGHDGAKSHGLVGP